MDKLRRLFFGLIFIGGVTFVYFITVPIVILYLGRWKVYESMDTVVDHQVGIVFGAGVKPDGTPYDMLEDRLIAAGDLYNAGKIQKILVSGDNRVEQYNEPQVMYDYLIEEFEIPEDDVIRDYAGRRTYDTCIRAKELWGVDEAVLISQGYHLSRAIFACNVLGMESTGYSATLREYIGEPYYKFREILAIHASVIDLFFFPPDYVGGEKEVDLI